MSGFVYKGREPLTISTQPKRRGIEPDIGWAHPYKVLATLVANGLVLPMELKRAAEMLEDQFRVR